MILPQIFKFSIRIFFHCHFGIWNDCIRKDNDVGNNLLRFINQLSIRSAHYFVDFSQVQVALKTPLLLLLLLEGVFRGAMLRIYELDWIYYAGKDKKTGMSNES